MYSRRNQSSVASFREKPNPVRCSSHCTGLRNPDRLLSRTLLHIHKSFRNHLRRFHGLSQVREPLRSNQRCIQPLDALLAIESVESVEQRLSGRRDGLRKIQTLGHSGSYMDLFAARPVCASLLLVFTQSAEIFHKQTRNLNTNPSKRQRPA